MSLSQVPLRRSVVALFLAWTSIAAATEQATAPPPGAPPKAPDAAGAQEAETEPELPSSWHWGGLGLRKGKSQIKLAGYVQEDLRYYDWEVKGDEEGTLQAPTNELGRLRVGVEGNLGKMRFEFVMDPRNSQEGDRLKDALLGYEFSRSLRLMAGHFKPPVSQEFMTSGSKTDLVDRSMLASDLSPDREWGVEIFGEPGRVQYFAGVFAGDGSANAQSAETSLAPVSYTHLTLPTSDLV